MNPQAPPGRPSGNRPSLVRGLPPLPDGGAVRPGLALSERSGFFPADRAGRWPLAPASPASSDSDRGWTPPTDRGWTPPMSGEGTPTTAALSSRSTSASELSRNPTPFAEPSTGPSTGRPGTPVGLPLRGSPAWPSSDGLGGQEGERGSCSGAAASSPNETQDKVIRALLPLVKRTMLSGHKGVFETSLQSLKRISSVFGHEALEAHLGTILDLLQNGDPRQQQPGQPGSGARPGTASRMGQPVSPGTAAAFASGTTQGPASSGPAFDVNPLEGRELRVLRILQTLWPSCSPNARADIMRRFPQYPAEVLAAG